MLFENLRFSFPWPYKDLQNSRRLKNQEQSINLQTFSVWTGAGQLFWTSLILEKIVTKQGKKYTIFKEVILRVSTGEHTVIKEYR